MLYFRDLHANSSRSVGVDACPAAMASTAASDGQQDSASCAERPAAGLGETAVATGAPAAPTPHGGHLAREVHDVAQDARRAAKRGGEVIAAATEAMARIKASSKKMSDATAVIDAVVLHTNLLALNAVIEAARAGKAGKGLAVIASEAESLALRSAAAAKVIKNLIATSGAEVADNASFVERAGAALGEIVMEVGYVAGDVGAIAATAGRQAKGAEEVDGTVARRAGLIEHEPVTIGNRAGPLHELETQLQQLNALVTSFRTRRSEVVAKMQGAAERTSPV